MASLRAAATSRPRRVALALALAACAALAALAACAVHAGSAVDPAFADQCALRLPGGSVRVLAPEQTYAVSTALSVTELDALRTETHREPGKATLGATVAKLKSSVNIASQMLRERGSGQVCMRARIEATLTYSPMQVYVAREFADNTCVHDHILAHELRHVQAHRAQLEHARERLEQAMRAHFGDRILFGAESDLRAQLERELKTRWLPLAIEYLREVRSLHAKIDTPEEYARNRTVCGGDVARALAGRRR